MGGFPGWLPSTKMDPPAASRPGLMAASSPPVPFVESEAGDRRSPPPPQAMAAQAAVKNTLAGLVRMAQPGICAGHLLAIAENAHPLCRQPPMRGFDSDWFAHPDDELPIRRNLPPLEPPSGHA